jgi:hypothetical protein
VGVRLLEICNPIIFLYFPLSQIKFFTQVNDFLFPPYVFILAVDPNEMLQTLMEICRAANCTGDEIPGGFI